MCWKVLHFILFVHRHMCVFVCMCVYVCVAVIKTELPYINE